MAVLAPLVGHHHLTSMFQQQKGEVQGGCETSSTESCAAGEVAWSAITSHVTMQVHEIADAVEEVKEFVRPTREKVRN